MAAVKRRDPAGPGPSRLAHRSQSNTTTASGERGGKRDRVAIDLGNFNTAVAIRLGDDGVVHNVTFNEGTTNVIPTQVNLDVITHADGEKEVSVNCNETYDKETTVRYTVRGFKSLIGRNNVHPMDDVMRAVRNHDIEFKFNGEKAVPSIVPMYVADPLSFETAPVPGIEEVPVTKALNVFVEAILLRAQQNGVDPSRADVCMTVPVNATMIMREQYNDAVNATWPDARVWITTEPYAAYLAHVLDDESKKIKIDKDIVTNVIFDFGHGTTDFGIVQVRRDGDMRVAEIMSRFPECNVQTTGRIFNSITNKFILNGPERCGSPMLAQKGVQLLAMQEVDAIKRKLADAATLGKGKHVAIRAALSQENQKKINAGDRLNVKPMDLMNFQPYQKKLLDIKALATQYAKSVRAKGITAIDEIVIVGGGAHNYKVATMVDEGIKAVFPEARRIASKHMTMSVVYGAMKYIDVQSRIEDASKEANSGAAIPTVKIVEQTTSCIGLEYVDEDDPSIKRVCLVIDKHVDIPVQNARSTIRMAVHEPQENGMGGFAMDVTLVEGEFKHRDVLTDAVRDSLAVFDIEVAINAADLDKQFQAEMSLTASTLSVDMIVGESVTHNDIRRIDGALVVERKDDAQHDAEADVPQAEADVPQAEADVPQAEPDVPQAEADVPQAEPDVPQAEADVPQAEPDVPQAEATEEGPSSTNTDNTDNNITDNNNNTNTNTRASNGRGGRNKRSRHAND